MLVSSVAAGVSGSSGVSGDASTGVCSLAIPGFPVASIDATCAAGECLVPTEGALDAQLARDKGGFNVNALLAALPTMALMAIVAVAGEQRLERHLYGGRMW